MSDIKTLREAVDDLDKFSGFPVDSQMVVRPPFAKTLAILCRREIERMEREAPVVSIKEITADALSAARDEGWNALIDHLTLKPSPLDLNTVAERLDAMRYLRKGPSND